MTMLKPFHIRDLRVAQPEQPADTGPNPAVIRISDTDYDEIASNHPRARLTYVDEDDDDDETITVGSALELSQRLEEPLGMNTRLESIQLQDDAAPMHIFDIRRSNSVTELWSRYRDNLIQQDAADDHHHNVSGVAGSVAHEDQHEVPASSDTTLPPVSNEPRSLMEAFEAELAEMMGSSGSSEKTPPRSTTPPIAEPSANAGSARTPHPVEVLAAQVMDQLVNGANMVQSEWRSRLPDLQRQLQNAQRQLEAAHRSLPQNVEVSLRALLATLESQLKTAFNNIPDSGRQMAEDAFQAGRPVAENAADGLRMMASEFNEVGKTLFAAFESEFGRHGPTSNSASEPAASGPTYPQASAYAPAPAWNEKSTAGPSEPNHTGDAATCPSANKFNPAPAGVPSRSDPSHGFPPRQAQPHLSPWMPPTNPHPCWNPFPTFHAPPPPPPPPYPSHPPVFQPSRSTPWPHWTPKPFTSNGPSKPKQAAVNKPVEPKLGPATKSLFIGNVGFKVTGKMIQDVFASKGFIVDVDLPTDASSRRHAGFGYVHFPSDYPAFAAIEALQGALIDGHSINLEHMDLPIEKSHHDSQALGMNPSGAPHAAFEMHNDQSSTIPDPLVPSATFGAPETRLNHESPINRRKSVSFIDATDNASTGQAMAESSALLDSPSDDAAISARFPSLLPQTNDQDNILHGTPDILESRTEMSQFPPVSQLEAQRLAGATGPTQTRHTTKSRRRSSENKPREAKHVHTPNHVPRSGLRHSASVRSTATTGTTASPPQQEQNVPPMHHRLPGSFPAEETRPAMNLVGDDSYLYDNEPVNVELEQCVSTLLDMGYGTEHEGGRSRMMVFAAAANGSLLDAIDMIEEERSAYERRASQ